MNGTPNLKVFDDLADDFLDQMNLAKRLNKVAPNPKYYAKIMRITKQMLKECQQWRKQAERQFKDHA